MKPPEIIKGLTQKNRQLTQKNDEMITLAEKRAQAERDYMVAARQETLKCRSDGEPVTLVPTLVKGSKHVADLKFVFEVCMAVEKANKEACENIRSQIDTYRSILSREKQLEAQRWEVDKSNP